MCTRARTDVGRHGRAPTYEEQICARAYYGNPNQRTVTYANIGVPNLDSVLPFCHVSGKSRVGIYLDA